VAKIVYFPLKRTELGKSQEISRVRRDHSDPQAGGAHCDQRIIRQSAPSNFLVVILGGQTGQHFAGLGPIRHTDLGTPMTILPEKQAYPFQDLNENRKFDGIQERIIYWLRLTVRWRNEDCE